MIKIRLTRGGRKKRPVYTIVATESRSPRDGLFLQKLGQYDPLDPKTVLKGLKVEELQRWVNDGAEVSDTVRSLLKKHKVSVTL